jgi:ribosome-associated translation inhibitor RaiA
MEPSPAVETRIRDEISKLERYFDRITSCRVVVEAPHHHQQRGRGFHIGIVIGVPGSKIAVTHEPSLRAAVANSAAGKEENHDEPQPDHKHIYVCIRDAFHAARHRLEDYARLLRGDVKRSAANIGTHLGKP